jgi:hypothetical protein
MKANYPQPKYEAISSLDTLVKTLTRERDGVKPFADDWKDVFLQALARAPILSVAARIAAVSPRRATMDRNADAGFARRWDEAMEEGLDEIEAAAYLSAVYGDQRPVFHQGLQIGWTTDYSDAMRSMLLKALRPQVFENRSRGSGGKQKPTAKRPGMTLEEFRKRVEEAKRP